MPKTKRPSTLSGLVDSDTDDARLFDNLPTPDSAAESKLPGKKARGRPKAAPSKVTKATKAPARRTSGRLNRKADAQGGMVPPTRKTRPALADKTNHQYGSDTEEVDDFELDEDAMMEDAPVASAAGAKSTKSRAAKTKSTAGRGRPKTVKEIPKPIPDTHEDELVAVAEPKSRAPKGRGRAKKEAARETSPEKVIAETQHMDVEDDGEEEVEETISRSSRNAERQRTHSRPLQPSIQHRRAGSASDTERNDPALRRRLGDMTKKYENLHLKYQDMREIGLKEAEKNFERFKKHSDERTKVSNDLITSLKADLAAQTALSKDSKSLKTRIESQGVEIAALHAQIAQMSTLLSEAQSENKTLSAKLAANRNIAASVESANNKPPSSVVKANGGIRMIGTAEVAQAAQLKEDIYSDLTGLIIRSVKRETEEDVFDCIQTGRNGTLHFKLAAANEKSSESYEDAQCSYTPQLDPSRDKALMELLPDYLTEEITFPRPQAAKFYARVVKALTEKQA